ncbi:MAG: hypothetical protein J7K40_01080 [candidate division Zixibacteria bacterium]|nr:hypothetical protein [candidate division Zixibacteria bacterium]
MSSNPLDSVLATYQDYSSLYNYSDINGNYQIPIFCEGFDIVFLKPGYNDVVISGIAAEPNDTIIIDAAMVPLAENSIYI